MATTTGRLPRPRTPERAPGPVPSRVADRFRVERVLHRGAGSSTLAATDESTGLPVVVKTARSESLSRGTRLRLLHEAQVLRGLSGAGLVPLVDAGESDGLLYLAMPRVDGRTLRERLAERRLGITETLAVAHDLLTALAVAHEHGVLHRDIKPSNVMVNDGEVQRATLIDFGLARSADLDEAVRDEPVGTARYMSPEQAGLVHRDVDERSDLYAVGVVLFECLIGRPPFTGSTVGEVLRQHLSAPAPDVRSYGVAVPTAIAQVVQRLLRKDARDRYQSATGVLADVDRIAHALRAGEADPVVPLGLHDRRASLTEPAFVGRREELSELLAAVRGARDGRGGVVLVEAESGGGKSRLLDELVHRAADGATLVLRGQGVDQAARRPFQLLEGVAGSLVTAARRDPELAARLGDRLAEDQAVLAGVLPRLRDLAPEPEAPELPGPERLGEVRALAALVRLLDAVGTAQRPALVLLDDCQWADEATVRLLRRWQSEVADRGSHVLVLAAFRAEEVRPGDPLRAVSAHRLVLTPFGDHDVRALVESMAGHLPQQALGMVTRLSGGSPFMAGAVVRGLVEGGALYHDGQAWKVDPTLMETAQSSHEAATFLTQRLDLLAADVSDLLVAGAVLGKQFDVELAADLVGAGAGAAVGALRSLRSRHLIWMDPDGLVATFVHDKLREALLDRLADDDRRALHARAAMLLGRQAGAVSSYDLAYHFHAAGDDAAALPHALAAATEARSRHALAAAEQQYRIALGGVDPADVSTSREVRTGLGDVLMLQGRYDEAAACFEAALAAATDSSDRAGIAYRLGELAFKRGEVPESVAHLEGALRSLHRHVPRHRAGFALLAVWEVGVQAAHCLLPRRLVARRRAERMDADLLAARVHSRLAYSYWFSRGRMPTAWAHLREMNLLERYPPVLELAQAYSEHAPVMTTLPWYSRGIAYVERSLEIRRRYGDVWGMGQSLHFYGVVLYAASRFEEAIDKLTEAIRLLDRTGDQWEINTAQWHIGFALYRLGRYDEAAETLRRCYDSALEIGDPQAAAISLSGIAKASGGQVDATEVSRALERCTGDVHTSAELLTGEGVRLLAAGDPGAAVEVLTRAWADVHAAGTRNEYVASILPWLLTALRVSAEHTGPYRISERRRILRRADGIAGTARRLGGAYRNNLPHVLREQALLARLAGRDRAARRLLDRATRVATAQQMAGELALLHDAAEAAATGRPPASPTTADAPPPPPPLPSELPEAPSLSLLDRFDALLRVGRAIATALTPHAVYAAVRLAAAELLRSEECAVVLVHADDGAQARLEPLDESSGLGVSEQLVRDALASGAVSVYSRDDTDDPSLSMVVRRARSALAAPVYVRGRPVACWYVVHRQLSGLFGAEETRLAEFVSALAGAALENAEGFTAAASLSQSLERRVEERTAELSVANAALRTTLAELEQANTELRRLDELKSDFVAMVSHELRSPLTSILGYCSTMLRHWEKVEDDQRRSFVEIVERQSRRLSGLVNDLLEMSRIESGRLDTQLRPVIVGPLVDEVVRDYEGRIDDLRLEGSLDVAVVADVEHLRRVLINLLDNAAKYGAPPVSVVVTDGADGVTVAVRDEGAGVPEDFRSRLFEKFAQASSGSTRKATGTGLGLSIVKGLVEAMDGSVGYEPPGAHGGAFVLRLPRAL